MSSWIILTFNQRRTTTTVWFTHQGTLFVAIVMRAGEAKMKQGAECPKGISQSENNEYKWKVQPYKKLRGLRQKSLSNT